MYRIATEADCEAVYRMICDMEAKTLPYDQFADIFRRQSGDPRYECIVREEDGQAMGVLNLRYEEQLHHAGLIAEIMEFVIAAGWRGAGRGSDMLAYACRRARERGCLQIEVACNQLRRDTQRFYLREGMKNFHFKFSKLLTGDAPAENALGR